MTTYIDKEEIMALEAFSSDSFLMINKSLIQIFGLKTAAFLCNIIDKYKYFRDRGMLQTDRSFFLTLDDQETQIGLSRYQLGKCKKELVEELVIKTSMKGIPPKEFYTINFIQIVKIIEKNHLVNNNLETKRIKKEKLSELKPKNLANIKDNKYNKNKYNNINIVQENKNKVVRKRKRKTTTTKKQSSPETKIYSSLTKQLIDIVETNFGRSLPNNINTSLWTTQFRLLHTKDGIPIKKIKEVMEWYEEYAGMEFIPECQSGGAFRNKFDKLENALFRTTKQKRNKKLPTGMQSWDKYDDIDEIKIVDGVVVHNPFKRKEEKDA